MTFLFIAGSLILVRNLSKVVIQVLQSHAGVLSSNHLSEEIEKLDVSHMRANSRMKSAGGSDSTADSYADDIETEANSYFQQMFSGQLSIDAMIQMLTHFKESSEKRLFFFLNLQVSSSGICCLTRLLHSFGWQRFEILLSCYLL